MTVSRYTAQNSVQWWQCPWNHTLEVHTRSLKSTWELLSWKHDSEGVGHSCSYTGVPGLQNMRNQRSTQPCFCRRHLQIHVLHPFPAMACTSNPLYQCFQPEPSLSILFAVHPPMRRSTVLVQPLHMHEQRSYKNEQCEGPDLVLSCRLIRLRAR